jgi:DNA-directed RNA polymerase specialized sigma24 family protein
MTILLESAEFRRVLKAASRSAFSRYGNSQTRYASPGELADDVMVRFGRWLPHYEGEADILTVLTVIARNLLTDARRHDLSAKRGRGFEDSPREKVFDSLPALSHKLQDKIFPQESDSPTELVDSLKQFQVAHPDPSKVAFIIMSFGKTLVHRKITDSIKRTLQKMGFTGIRADENWHHNELWSNTRTYLHGCGFGIAVIERLEEEHFNPNVSLEIGYMLALRSQSAC